MSLRHGTELSKMQKSVEERDNVLKDLVDKTPDDKKGEMSQAIEKSYKLWSSQLQKQEEDLRKREEEVKAEKAAEKQMGGMSMTKMLQTLAKRKAAERLAEKVQIQAKSRRDGEHALQRELKAQKDKVQELTTRLSTCPSKERPPDENVKELQRLQREIQSSKAAHAADSRKAADEKSKHDREIAKMRSKHNTEQKELKDNISALERRNTLLGNTLVQVNGEDEAKLRKRVSDLECANAEAKSKLADVENSVKQRCMLLTGKT
eukprot:gene8191-13399_t